MEHAPFDVKGLSDYMRGLAQGGPTKSGHRTPAVIVNVPVNGTDEQTVRANAWMFQQVLATGVHGILLCHADAPGAVRAFIEAVRTPANGGRRGVHGNSTAARIWGISADEYGEKADVWPLNPKGELLLGLKVENVRALSNVEATLAVPGIAFAEWGPGDMGMSLGFPDNHDEPYPAPRAISFRSRSWFGRSGGKITGTWMPSWTAGSAVTVTSPTVTVSPSTTSSIWAKPMRRSSFPAPSGAITRGPRASERSDRTSR